MGKLEFFFVNESLIFVSKVESPSLERNTWHAPALLANAIVTKSNVM